jgi:hypothetical protein
MCEVVGTGCDATVATATMTASGAAERMCGVAHPLLRST